MHTFKTRLSLGSTISILFLGGTVWPQGVAPRGTESEGITANPLLSRVSVGVFSGGGFMARDVELGNSFFDEQVPGSGVLLGTRGAFVVLPTMAESTRLNPRLSFEGELRLILSSTGSSAERASSFAPVLGWRAHLLLDLFAGQRWVPFVLAGLGAETVFGSNNFMKTPETDMAGHAGAGVKYAVRDNFGIRVDVRLGVTAGRSNAAAPIYEVHLGGYYQFGAPAKDSVSPIRRSTVRELDRDGDGVADADDQCPGELETINRIGDDDGCPEVDSDGDGLLGTRDGCPDAKEDLDGFEDSDGCPDLDNDRDGIEDVADKCPLNAESDNGFQDEDGCPDEVPESVAQFTGTIEGIRFGVGSASIVPASRKTLDAAVRVLTEYPQVRIEVGGHTDRTGSRDANMELSGKRADYVKWYLVDKGISADRIETVGYGPDRPRADNEFPEGRAQNRRIEFKLLGPRTD